VATWHPECIVIDIDDIKAVFHGDINNPKYVKKICLENQLSYLKFSKHNPENMSQVFRQLKVVSLRHDLKVEPFLPKKIRRDLKRLP
jgi:hypothetical protein